MSVTVEVRGVPTGGGGAPAGGDSSGGGASGRTGAFLPTDERMIADIRREMQSRGVLLVPGSQGLQQIIGQYRQQLNNQATSQVEERFQPRREALAQKKREELARIDRQLEDFYRPGLESSSEEERRGAQEALDRDRRFKEAQLNKRIQKEEEALDSEEAAAKSQAETELTDAIKRLTDALEREAKSSPDLPDSYINRLRTQQKALIKERDEAGDESGAIAASKRLAEVNEKLRRAMTGEDTTQNRGGGGWGVALSGMRGFEQFGSAAASGNLGGMISGIGGAGVGIASAVGGLSLGAAATAMGVVGLLAAIGAGIQSSGARYDELSGLAAFRGTIPGVTNLRNGAKTVGSTIRTSTLGGRGMYNYADLGMSEIDFANEADRRIRARGMSDDWFNETYRQIGLERNYALREGSLMSAGAYDRYGIAGTEAVVRLVDMLSRIQGSGVSQGDFTRVQEKLDIQQQIMGSFMSRADRPNYDVANRAVAAMSAVRGITQDSRVGSDYAVMQNALQNPMNDRMKALIYGTVEDIIPGTRGRMDLIDQALRDPNQEGKILQAVIQRVNTMYGGMDSQMGYFAFRNIFPGIAPDRLRNYIQDFSNPNSEASKILLSAMRGESTAAETDILGRKKVDEAAAQGTQLTSGITSTLKDIAGDVHGIWDWIVGTNNGQGVDAGRGVRSGWMNTGG